MKIIYVSRSATGKINPFVKEQAESLSTNYPVDIQHFLIPEGGVKGYLKAIISFYHFARRRSFDIVHVHYGLWSLVPVLNKYFTRKKFKIVITYHGSDINKGYERKISLLGALFSSCNILVSDKMLKFFHGNSQVLPCGINVNVKLNRRECTRKKYGWHGNDFVVLFTSAFDREIKDPAFAFEVINNFARTTQCNVKFIELKGYTREQVTCLMQAADVLMMCSKSEGSPQVIKEAILNSLPVIANDVGDVGNICEGVDCCYIIQKDMQEYINCLQMVSRQMLRIKNRKPVIEKFDNDKITQKLYHVYTGLLQ
jgi:glycosyltransferase involved in cell wall biosynthesis